jgi:hypothetical protein
MNSLEEAERWDAIIGIPIFFIFIGGIALAFFGGWLHFFKKAPRGKKLVAIGTFTALAALIASLFETAH